jgi:hypothetical protein
MQQLAIPDHFTQNVQLQVQNSIQGVMNVILPSITSSIFTTMLNVQQQALQNCAHNTLARIGLERCAFPYKDGHKCNYEPAAGSKYCTTKNHKAAMNKRNELERLRETVNDYENRKKRVRIDDDDDTEPPRKSQRTNKKPIVESPPSSPSPPRGREKSSSSRSRPRVAPKPNIIRRTEQPQPNRTENVPALPPTQTPSPIPMDIDKYQTDDEQVDVGTDQGYENEKEKEKGN